MGKSAKISTRTLSNLPPEMLLEILSRLPTESVLQCKLVCKQWRILVYHPSFSQMHLSHLTDHGNVTFLILSLQLNEEKRQMFYNLEYNENHHKKYKPLHRITRLNINPPFQGYTIIGSCNGLICLNALHDLAPSSYQPAYICNPITKEYITLPEINRFRYPTAYFNLGGFGYLPETNEYKVVRILQLWGKTNPECVEVYTIGSSHGWRNVGDRELPSYVCNLNDHGVFFSGTLYWITSKGKIVAFNMADERFYELQTLHSLPLADHKECSFRIRVSDGCLWCSTHDIRTKRTSIRVLTKQRNKGNQKVMEQEEYMSLTLGEEFFDKKPIAVMKSGKVVFSNCSELYIYENSCIKKLVKFPYYFHQTIPHMNTFISLKALGEQDTKTMEDDGTSAISREKKRIRRR